MAAKRKKSLASIISALKSEEKRLARQHTSVEKGLQHVGSDLRRVQSALAVLQMKDQPPSRNDHYQNSGESTSANSQIELLELGKLIDTLLSGLTEVKSEISERLHQAVQKLTLAGDTSEKICTLRAFDGKNGKRIRDRSNP